MESDITLTQLAAMKFYSTGYIKGLNLKGTWTAVQNLEADGCSRTPLGAMLRRPFRYRRSFMYAAVSDISYHSGKGCILGKGKRLGGEIMDLQYQVWLLRNINVKLFNCSMAIDPIAKQHRSRSEAAIVELFICPLIRD